MSLKLTGARHVRRHMSLMPRPEARHVSLVTGFLVTMLTAIVGCSSTPKPPPPLDAGIRATLGKIGVVSTSPLSATVSGAIGVGNGAAKGAGIGTLEGAGAGAVAGLGCGPFLPVCVPLFAAAGAGGGFLIGAAFNGFDAIPTSAAENIRAHLAEAIGDEDLQAELRRRVVYGSSSASDLGTSMGDVSMAMRGVDTVLEINITQIALIGSGGRNPDLALAMNANARLVRVADNQVIWSNNQIAFNSGLAEFTSWEMDDAKLLKAAIPVGLNSLARQIEEQIFLKANLGRRIP
jgi:hypothetical protein